MQSTDLWTRGRSRGAKTSKEIEKCDFLVVQRCGNSYFRWKHSKPSKNHRTEGGTYPNRPSRSRWSQKFGDWFVFGGGTLRYLRFRNFECQIFARSVHIRSKPTIGRWGWPKSTLAVPTEPEFLKSDRIWWEFLSKTPSGPNRPPYRDNGRAGETVWPLWNSSKNFQNESKLNFEL